MRVIETFPVLGSLCIRRRHSPPPKLCAPAHALQEERSKEEDDDIQRAVELSEKFYARQRLLQELSEEKQLALGVATSKLVTATSDGEQ